MLQVTCLELTGKKYDLIVLLETAPTFPFLSSNFIYVKVAARSFGEAAKLAKNYTSGNIARAFYLN